MAKKKIIGLSLTPLDLLACGNANPLASTLVLESRLPLPQVLTGALRTFLLDATGCSLAEIRSFVRENPDACVPEVLTAGGAPQWLANMRVRGPWLARTGDRRLDVCLPLPANLIMCMSQDSGHAAHHFQNLAPLHPSITLPAPIDHALGSESDALRPLWHRHACELKKPTSLYMTLAGATAYLSGQTLRPNHVVAEQDLFKREPRVGIAVDNATASVQEGAIFTVSFLRLCPEVTLYAELELPEGAPAAEELFAAGRRTLRLGAEGRRVVVEPVRRVQWPHARPREQRTSYLLVTPGLFHSDRGMPDLLPGTLCSAAASGAVPISGFDVARERPKPARFAIAAGAVYFTTNAAPDGSADPLTQLSSDQNAAAMGYGLALSGGWDYVS